MQPCCLTLTPPRSLAARSLGRVANEAFATAVSKWAFQERGVLRAANLTHRVVSGAHPGAVEPERYRVNDEVGTGWLGGQQWRGGHCGRQGRMVCRRPAPKERPLGLSIGQCSTSSLPHVPQVEFAVNIQECTDGACVPFK